MGLVNDTSRLRSVRSRWDSSQKISTRDVRWLLDIADAASTRDAADSLRQGHGDVDRLKSVIDDLLRGGHR